MSRQSKLASWQQLLNQPSQAIESNQPLVELVESEPEPPVNPFVVEEVPEPKVESDQLQEIKKVKKVKPTE